MRLPNDVKEPETELPAESKLQTWQVKVELKPISRWITVTVADEVEAALLAENKFLRAVEGEVEARAAIVRLKKQ